MPEIIGQRVFRPEDLLWFAAGSGDWNPIHVDPVRARRTLAGELVVHGMFSLLWALECHFATHPTPSAKIVAYFQRPILPNERLRVSRAIIGDEVRLGVSRKGEVVASVALSGVGKRVDDAAGQTRPPRGEPVENTFEALRGAHGSVEITASAKDIAREFARVAESTGALPVAGIMACSRLVGMECPGLHSLFAGLEIRLDGPTNAQMDWSVARQSSPYAPLVIAVSGGGMSGKLQAFVRPEPVAQLSISEVAKNIAPGAAVGQKALIIGGSRGLGELTAKALAAGGAEVAITYRSGAQDAARVADDITSWGGKCRCLQADVERPAELVAALQGWAPTHLYYFATPKISSQKSGVFDDALYAVYHRAYVAGFESTVRALCAYTQETLCVFYPSTVFVDEPPKEFAAYVTAKQAGEALCKLLERELPTLRVLVDRLPRMKTDQTASLLPQPAKPALQEIERVLRQMQMLGKQG